MAGGLRTPHGIGWGPENGIFVTDNQGGWLPSSKLVQIKQNRFFNHYMTPAGPFESQPVTQPVLWMPQNEIANSPSTPLYMSSGSTPVSSSSVTSPTAACSGRTWRRSTASTRARCSG